MSWVGLVELVGCCLVGWVGGLVVVGWVGEWLVEEMFRTLALEGSQTGVVCRQIIPVAKWTYICLSYFHEVP